MYIARLLQPSTLVVTTTEYCACYSFESIVVTRLQHGCYNLLLQPCGQVVTTKHPACNNQILCLLQFQKHSCYKVVDMVVVVTTSFHNLVARL